jgi:hypothetical protein
VYEVYVTGYETEPKSNLAVEIIFTGSQLD